MLSIARHPVPSTRDQGLIKEEMPKPSLPAGRKFSMTLRQEFVGLTLKYFTQNTVQAELHF